MNDRQPKILGLSLPLFFRRGCLFVSLLIGGVSCFGQTIAPAPQHQPSSARYAGADVCARCHEASSFNMEGTAHGKVDKAGTTGCEVCHGPGAAHAEAHGDRSKIFVFDPENESSRARCMSCHINPHPDMRPAHRELNCLQCHAIHRSKEEPLLRLSREKLCRSCH